MPPNFEKLPIKTDPTRDRRAWFYYPDTLPGGKFRGFEDRDDATQLRGAFVVGQNVKIGADSLPVTRDGFEVIGTEASDATPVQRAWVFRRRDDVQIELKAYATGIYAWIVGVSTEFKLLKGGFTTSLEFGVANIGQTDQLFSWEFFCNGTENPFRWTGAYGLYASDNGSNTITVSGSVTLANLGFSATGTLIINGVEITYTGLSSQTFTGCSAVPASPTVGDIIFQTPVELTGSVGGGTDPVKFSVSMSHDGRLHYRREARKSVWDYSRLDNPDDIAVSVADGEGGTKEIEFGGPITAFGKLNRVAIAFKRNIIKTLSFVQSGTRLDVPYYQTLVSADDKSTTIGAVNQRSTFSTPYGLVFTTPDKRMLLLTGVTANNEPAYVVLSDLIQPIFDQGVHDDACGICVDNVIFYAFKQDINSTYNDTVIRGDMTRQSIDSVGRVLPIRWDTPTIGWTAKDFTSIYNAVTGKNEVHWHSALNSNSYRVITDKSDNTNSFSTSVRSWSETFDQPTRYKIVDRIWVEVRMSENTEILLTVLYDENGVTGQEEHSLDGDSTNNKFSSAVYNPFGLNAFGSQKFGSEAETTELPLYRFEIPLKANIRFFNIALQFSTDDAGYNFQVVRFGYRLKELVQETDRKYMSA